MVNLSTDTKNHRMGAYIYGFLSGVGLILIIWGLASITMLPSRYLMMNISLTLFGVILFACGSCREAYLRGNLSAPAKIYNSTENLHEKTHLISEQIKNPEEDESQKIYAS